MFKFNSGQEASAQWGRAHHISSLLVFGLIFLFLSSWISHLSSLHRSAASPDLISVYRHFTKKFKCRLCWQRAQHTATQNTGQNTKQKHAAGSNKYWWFMATLSALFTPFCYTVSWNLHLSLHEHQLHWRFLLFKRNVFLKWSDNYFFFMDECMD